MGRCGLPFELRSRRPGSRRPPAGSKRSLQTHAEQQHFYSSGGDYLYRCRLLPHKARGHYPATRTFANARPLNLVAERHLPATRFLSSSTEVFQSIIYDFCLWCAWTNLLRHSDLRFFSFTPDLVSVLDADHLDSPSDVPVTASRLLEHGSFSDRGGCSSYAVLGVMTRFVARQPAPVSK